MKDQTFLYVVFCFCFVFFFLISLFLEDIFRSAMQTVSLFCKIFLRKIRFFFTSKHILLKQICKRMDIVFIGLSRYVYLQRVHHSFKLCFIGLLPTLNFFNVLHIQVLRITSKLNELQDVFQSMTPHQTKLFHWLIYYLGTAT